MENGKWKMEENNEEFSTIENVEKIKRLSFWMNSRNGAWLVVVVGGQRSMGDLAGQRSDYEDLLD